VELPRLLIAAAALLVFLATLNLAENLAGRYRADVRVAAESAVEVGYVANTDGIGVYLRRSPTMDDLLHAVPEGTALKLFGAETRVDGVSWRQVEEPAGFRGWVPSQYVRIELTGAPR
jgi:hypothetical protein